MTTIQSLDDTALPLETQATGDPDTVWAADTKGLLRYRWTEGGLSVGSNQRVTPLRPMEACKEDGATPINVELSDTAAERADAIAASRQMWHRHNSSIFCYAIIYPVSLSDTVAAFLATASGQWSRQRAKGQTPDDWQITSLSDDHEMVVVDATLAQASQYGSAEAIASQTAEFTSVDVVQWLNPDVQWNGMALTNPETGLSEQYGLGEARINTLKSIQQHQQVTANDIPSLTGHKVA